MIYYNFLFVVVCVTISTTAVSDLTVL